MSRWNIATDSERFWTKVQKGDGCWEWMASKDTKGYGQFWVEGATHPWKAHRVAYLLEYGVNPDKQFVCHRCDNPACVRPDHLFLGTHIDNMQDMKRKGRAGGFNKRIPAGESNPRAKLCIADVFEIRRLYSARTHTQVELARQFGIGQSQISRIVRGEEWEGY